MEEEYDDGHYEVVGGGHGDKSPRDGESFMEAFRSRWLVLNVSMSVLGLVDSEVINLFQAVKDNDVDSVQVRNTL